MTTREKFIEFVVKPPLWLCIAVWVMGAGTLTGSIVLYYMGLGLEDAALPVHFFALLYFVLSIYAVLTVIGIPKRAKSSVRIQNFFKSYSARAFVFAFVSVIFNVGYVAFGIVLALYSGSEWLFALVGYHVFLILPRFTVMYFSKLRKGDSEEGRARQNIRAYAYCGLALILLSIALIPVINMVALDENSYDFFVSAIVYVTAIALYSFTKLGIAVFHFKKAHKTDDLPLIAIKNVSFSDALISIFMLQAMMITVLPNGSDIEIINPIVGSILAVGIFALGLYMMVVGLKKLKALPNEENEEGNENSELI